MKFNNLRHITIFIFFIISNTSFAQTRIDSLENALGKASGINRIDVLMSLSESYIQISPQKSIEYAREAHILINNNNKKQKTFKNISIAGSTAILILLILYILSFKNKIKANNILLEQNEQIRNKNLEIKQKTENLSKINRELEKLSIAASQTDNAIIIINPDGEIEWVNEGFTRLYGYTYEEYITVKGKTYVESGLNPEIKETFNQVITEKKSQIFEANIVSKDGVEYRIHTTLTPVLNSENKVVRLIAIDSDVTKLKEAEDELQKLLVTKDKFFSIIAHDLKNPFNTLIGLSQLLVRGYDRMSPEKVKYFHNNLYQISKNGYELLINLLEWSRAQTGNIQFKPEVHNLFALAEETFTLYSTKAIQKEILLTNNLNKNSEIFADKNMLKTIFRNIVSNALKFSDRGGVIEISEKDSGDFKEISIRDTGVGINPDDIKKLFKLDESFTTEGTEDEPGTGLGLLLCKEFVEKHDGSIRVESKAGFGSNFIFTLPQANKKPS